MELQYFQLLLIFTVNGLINIYLQYSSLLTRGEYSVNRNRNRNRNRISPLLLTHVCVSCNDFEDAAKLNSTEWYFFSFRDRKYATGYRTNRATTSGYWKATGKDRTVVDPRTNCIVGMRKTLVFYKNRAPNGLKTGWIMHEFRLENPLIIPPKEDWVLCRVFYKSKTESNTQLSPQNVYHSEATFAGAHTFPNPPQIILPPACNKNNYHLHQITTSQNPNNLPTSSQLNPNFLHLSHQTQTNHLNEMIMLKSVRDEEDPYGFLLNMEFEEGHMGDEIASSVEDMKFEDDYCMHFPLIGHCD